MYTTILFNFIYRGIGNLTPMQAERPENFEKVRLINEQKYSSIKRSKHIKYKVNDLVRISKLPDRFRRSYQQQNMTEIFRISEIKQALPKVLYKLKSLTNENIIGNFYQSELVKIIPDKENDVHLVDKILKTKGNKRLVSWKGYGKEHNSWVNVDSIKTIEKSKWK